MSRLTELSPLLYQALGEPIGLLLLAAEPQKAMQALHQVKYKAGDPALMVLQIRMVEHPEGNIAITKGLAAPAPKAQQQICAPDGADPTALGL